MLQAIIDWLGIPIVLHDPAGHVIASSNRGRDLLRRRTFRRTLASPPGKTRTTKPTISRRQRDTLIKVTRTLRWRRTFLGERTVIASKVLTEAAPGNVEEYQARHGLSAIEARVAWHLVAGLPPKAIAKEEGIKLSTVRTHLRHIFWKTGTANQAELVALLLASDPHFR